MLSTDQQARLTEALRFALEHHAGQYRKGTTIPYVSHLLQVSGLVLEFGGDVDQAVAALLHDALEDCPTVNVPALEEEFGPVVTAIVRDCSDTLACEGEAGSPKPSWQERKDRYLAHMEQADPRSILVAVCDKVHNIGNIVEDLEEDGPRSLERFSASPERQVWYFTRVLEIARGKVPHGLYRRLDQSIQCFTAAITP